MYTVVDGVLLNLAKTQLIVLVIILSISNSIVLILPFKAMAV